MALAFATINVYAQVQVKSRVVVLTDIENEPDDAQSLVRLLLYSNLFDLGAALSTPTWCFCILMAAIKCTTPYFTPSAAALLPR
jgi:hypothetical protein